MTIVMTPSVKPITKGQAGKFVDVAVDALVKSGLPSEPTQQVLEEQGAALADEFIGLVRKRVEAMSNIIVRRVKVNRNRAPQAMLDATGRTQYTNKSIVAAMPHGDGGEVEVVFFKLDRWVSDSDLDKEYALRGLIPADPYSQGAVNETDPAFADDRPNGTHWKDAEGKYCYATFNRWSDERGVNVYRNVSDWHDCWWFAGLRKK
jgi:hypothetical protein